MTNPKRLCSLQQSFLHKFSIPRRWVSLLTFSKLSNLLWIYVYIRSLLKNLHNNTNNISFPCVIYVLLSYFGESSKLSVMNNEYLPSPCSVSPSLCVKTNHCKDEKYKRKYKNKMMKKFSKFFSLSLLERLSRSVTIPIDYLTK